MKGICSVGMALVYILLAILLSGCEPAAYQTIYAKHIREAASLCESNNDVAYIHVYVGWYEVVCSNGARFDNIQK